MVIKLLRRTTFFNKKTPLETKGVIALKLNYKLYLFKSIFSVRNIGMPVMP